MQSSPPIAYHILRPIEHVYSEFAGLVFYALYVMPHLVHREPRLLISIIIQKRQDVESMKTPKGEAT